MSSLTITFLISLSCLYEVWCEPSFNQEHFLSFLFRVELLTTYNELSFFFLKHDDLLVNGFE